MTRLLILVILCFYFSSSLALSESDEVRQVSITGTAYVPASFSIAAGNEIEWTNDDIVS